MACGDVNSAGMMVVVVCQILLTVLAVRFSEAMRLEWIHILPANENADVVFLQPPQFWGPACGIVPRGCFGTNSSVASDHDDDDASNDSLVNKAILKPGAIGPVMDPKTGQIVNVQMASMDGQHLGFSFDVLLQALLPSFSSSDGTLDKMGVMKCGMILLYDFPSTWRRYLSMMTFTRLFLVGVPTLEQIKAARFQFRRIVVVCIGLSMILKYGVALLDMFSKYFKYEYMQVWNQSRTRSDRILESALVHSMAIVFIMVLQVALCTMHFTFWREDHFVLSFLPGTGIIIFLAGIGLVSSLTVLDRVFGFMLRQVNNRALITFWVVYSIYMALVTIPMIGYCLFSFNYLYSVNLNGWLQAGGFLTEQFVTTARHATVVCVLNVLVGIMDFVLMIRIDLEKHGKPVCVAPERDPLRDGSSRIVELDPL
eukprot:TRINITY_DN48767_c0_g1_i1.p1 TRINITY_DN48767_c0_g1~~TRINITY_DN48767_c0_g1_i1.p1  ORF type:complete len:426 (+),score=30.95 TRINITY_DN48767_c0_g1_i1:138-1415(+)